MKAFDFLRDFESTAAQRVVEHRKGTEYVSFFEFSAQPSGSVDWAMPQVTLCESFEIAKDS